MRTQLQTTRVLFDTFNKKKLTYCSWKSNEHLEHGLNGESDLDILVSERDKELCKEILYRNNFKQLVSPSWMHYPLVEDWIGLDQETGKLIHVHLHYELPTGKKLVKEQLLPWTDKILKTRIFDDNFGVYVINPNFELITLVLRIGIKARFTKVRSKFPENIIKEINYLRERSKRKKVLSLCRELFGDKEGEKLANIILNIKTRISLSDFLYLKKNIQKNIAQYKRFNFLKTNLLYYYRALKIRFFKLINKTFFQHKTKKRLYSSGIMIAFVGIDGSGKSTATDRLYNWLSVYLNVRKIYFGWNNSFVSGLKKIKKNVFKGSGKQKTSNTESTFRQGFLFYCFAIFLALSKYRKLKNAYRLRNSGNVILADRYPTNRTSFGSSDGPMIDEKYVTNFLTRTFFTLENKIYRSIREKYDPDVVIRLNISPSEAIKRKPNHNISDLNKKHKILNCADFGNSKVVNVDSTKDLETLLLKIKNILWKMI
ncbi:MAG: hypothetical protein WD335_01125 [Candidatus Paceibacterota bacterium]